MKTHKTTLEKIEVIGCKALRSIKTGKQIHLNGIIPMWTVSIAIESICSETDECSYTYQEMKSIHLLRPQEYFVAYRMINGTQTIYKLFTQLISLNKEHYFLRRNI